MIKDVIISAMAAVLAVDKLSGIVSMSVWDQTGLWIGITAILIIFCVFLGILADKWRKRRARVRQLQRILSRLTGEGVSGQKRRSPKQ